MRVHRKWAESLQHVLEQAALAAALLLIGAPAFAGDLSGIVQDLTGSVVVGAEVHASGPVERSIYTDSEGAYHLQELPEGEYRVEARKEGFETTVATAVVGSQPVSLSHTLEPSALIESLTVSAIAPAVEAVTKMPASLHETPRSITVYNAEEMRQRDFRDVNDLLLFTPGMSVNSYRTGGYHFYARGYRMGPDDTLVDGFAGMNVSGGYTSSLFGVEDAAVLRGPASLLYGATSRPGGMINVITKKPRPQRRTSLDLRSGAYAGGGLSLNDRPSLSFDLDSTGALDRSERILYRALATVENQRYFTRYVLDRNRYGMASMTFRLDRDGRFTLTPVARYATFVRPTGGGIIASPSTSLSANDGVSGPINESDLSSYDVNLSGGGRFDRTSQLGADFRADISSKWKANLSYRTLRLDTDINQWTPQVSSADQIRLLDQEGLVNRSQSKSNTDRRYDNVDANVSHELRGSGWRNFTQVGFYRRTIASRGTSLLGPAPAPGAPIHIYTGLTSGPLLDLYPGLLLGDWSDTTNWNTYVQNRTAVFQERLVFTLGLGYGQSLPDGREARKGDLIPNLSLLFNATPSLALYGSYTESFNPIDPTLENLEGVRGGFNPTTGKNYEFGAKYDLPSRKTSATVAYFRNSLSNALVQTGINDVNVNGNRYYVEGGSSEAWGLELSTDHRVTRDWIFTGAATYIAAIFLGDGPPSSLATLALPGSPAEKTPRWSWSARTHYQVSEGKLRGLGAGVSAVWQGRRLGSNGPRRFGQPDPLILPAFSRVDASISYQINDHIDWSLFAENLFDQRIFVNATVGSAIEVAPPRGLTTRIGFSF